nr:putative sulfate exporter family transporter [uncultured Desulfuromonas sp.]
MNPLAKPVYLIAIAICLLPMVSAPVALALGIVYGLTWQHPWPQINAEASRKLLQSAVVGLGFGVPLLEVWQVGKGSFFSTLAGILITLAIGSLLGRWLKVPQGTSLLVSCGTAICGGSAIAAMSPVIKAENDESAVALATVFTLNAVALLVFPLVGHLFHLEQHQFGTWAGMAIHDTSSVVGAAASYGIEALETATTVKLTRALWIAPLALIAGLLTRSGQRAKIPLFIVLFIAAAAIHSALPNWEPAWHTVATVARHALVLSLFFVGAGLNRTLLKKVGARTLTQGITLWLIISALTLTAVHYRII